MTYFRAGLLFAFSIPAPSNPDLVLQPRTENAVLAEAQAGEGPYARLRPAMTAGEIGFRSDGLLGFVSKPIESLDGDLNEVNASLRADSVSLETNFELKPGEGLVANLCLKFVSMWKGEKVPFFVQTLDGKWHDGTKPLRPRKLEQRCYDILAVVGGLL